MSTKKIIESTAIEIVDLLYFYDVVSVCSFNEEKSKFYIRLTELLDIVVKLKKLNDKKAVIYKHYLLCGLEIFTSFDKDRIWYVSSQNLSESEKRQIQDAKYINNVTIPLHILRDSLNKNGRFEGDFIDDVRFLLKHSKIEEASNEITYRLVAQMLGFNYNHCVSSHIFRKFVNLKIIGCAQQTRKGKYIDSQHRFVFLRALLFIEFELLRKDIYYRCEAGVQNVDINFISYKADLKKQAYYLKYLKFMYVEKKDVPMIDEDIDLQNAEQVKNHILSISDILFHNCIFSSTKGNWVSLLGSILMLNQYRFGNHRVFSPLNNDDSCSDIAQKILYDEFDFSITSKSLYSNFRVISKIFCFIKENMTDIINRPKEGFVSPELATYFFFSPNMTAEVFEILGKTKL